MEIIPSVECEVVNHGRGTDDAIESGGNDDDVSLLDLSNDVFTSVEGEGVKFGRSTDGAIESEDRHRHNQDRTYEADRPTAGETKSAPRFAKMHGEAPLRLAEFCFGMIGRADFEWIKSNVAINAWLPQASYPCGNFLAPLASNFSSHDQLSVLLWQATEGPRVPYEACDKPFVLLSCLQHSRTFDLCTEYQH